MKRLLLFYILITTFCGVLTQLIPEEEVRWCTINDFEFKKCEDLRVAISKRIALNRTYSPSYIGKLFHALPRLKCVQNLTQFGCMEMIMADTADLMQLETSLSYTAGQYYSMFPLMAEKYQTGDDDKGLDFYAVALINASKSNFDITTLKNKNACFPEVGQAAGWVYPISFLLEKNYMSVAQCNVPVKSAASYFGDMCAPDGTAKYYNTFGTNPATVCKSCIGKDNTFCNVNDPYAGYSGAIDCLIKGNNDIAFVRHTSLTQYLANVNNSNLTPSQFMLLCTDGRKVDIDSWATCNWGQIASHVVMTSNSRSQETRTDYKGFLALLSLEFGEEGISKDLFQLFKSSNYGKQNLLFTDETKILKDISQVAGGTRATYYSWAVMSTLQPTRMDLKSRLNVLNSCPVNQVNWCVISAHEMDKCEKMIMAFSAKNLKPDLNCIKGDGVYDCIKKIQIGDADLITLDAADVYIAAKKYGLIPIAAEVYSGLNDTGYYAVAAARKRYSFMLLHNLKQRRSCHAGVMTAAGWVKAVDVLIETGQVNVFNGGTYFAVSEYFSKSCVPGVLEKYYNPFSTNPINLCEACSTAGKRRCVRNDDELYFGSSGAFRCLVEVGGDISFIRHMTIRENTNGNNLADWARNRRPEDYELLCKDGSRTATDKWMDCNLGWLPSNAVMTAGFKGNEVRDIYWTLLSYAQQFFDADDNPDFAMFDSMLNHKDLLFQDATVRLVSLLDKTYTEYLGEDFVLLMERMLSIDKVTGSFASTFSTSFCKLSTIFSVLFFMYFWN